LKSLFEAEGMSSDGVQVSDGSGGLWRRFAYHAEGEWPPVAAQFERMKLRCTGAQTILWKFSGLGSLTGTPEDPFGKLSHLAELGFTAKPIARTQGFIGTPWIEGTRLTIADSIDPLVQKRIADYILAVSGPFLDPGEHRKSVARLAEMLFWNTKEALGEEMAERTQILATAASDVGSLSAGDGRLAPHEWVRTGAGDILKTDCEGFSCDHTIIGQQSLLWDVAGALTEWNLELESAGAFVQTLEEQLGRIDVNALRFYEFAYAAFRMGLMSLSLSQTTDAGERQRLQNAFFFYQNKLSHWLTVEVPSSIAHSNNAL
jgi:hypothetical protein